MSTRSCLSSLRIACSTCHAGPRREDGGWWAGTRSGKGSSRGSTAFRTSTTATTATGSAVTAPFRVDAPRHAANRRAHRGPRVRSTRVRRRQDQPEGFVLEDHRLTDCGFPCDSGSARYRAAMALDLYAGIPVSDFEAAKPWYERLLGVEPSFIAHATEAVWELAEHRSVFIVEEAERAGGAIHTIFVDDLDACVADIASRGIEPDERITYPGKARKAIYRDADGNELGFGGAIDSVGS